MSLSPLLALSTLIAHTLKRASIALIICIIGWSNYWSKSPLVFFNLKWCMTVNCGKSSLIIGIRYPLKINPGRPCLLILILPLIFIYHFHDWQVFSYLTDIIWPFWYFMSPRTWFVLCLVNHIEGIFGNVITSKYPSNCVIRWKKWLLVFRAFCFFFFENHLIIINVKFGTVSLLSKYFLMKYILDELLWLVFFMLACKSQIKGMWRFIGVSLFQILLKFLKE